MIIKNCPAIKEITTLLTSEPPQFQKEWRCCTTGSNLKKCENINDCVMKKIVELCKEQKVINCNIDGKEQVLKAYYHTHLGNKIFELLDIEECE